MIGDILLFEGTMSKRLPNGGTSFAGKVPLEAAQLGTKLRGSEESVMADATSALMVAAAVIVILLVAFILARAQDKLPELGLDLIVSLCDHAYRVCRRAAARLARRTPVDRGKGLATYAPARDDRRPPERAAPCRSSSRRVENDEEVTVYEVAGERIHFGETVAYGALRLSVRPGRRICSPTFSGTPVNLDRHDMRSWLGRLCPTPESR